MFFLCTKKDLIFAAHHIIAYLVFYTNVGPVMVKVMGGYLLLRYLLSLKYKKQNVSLWYPNRGY